MDGNVYRVLARIFEIDIPINSTGGKREFARLAAALLDKKNPGIYNQAIMEFGALYCTPRNPACTACIFVNICQSGLMGRAKYYPVKQIKVKSITRYFEYFIIRRRNKIYVQQRKEKDIWKNLNQFPMMEYKEKAGNKTILEELKKSILPVKRKDFIIEKQTFYRKHILSHQIIFARFTYIKTDKLPGTVYKAVSLKQLEKMPFPVLLAKEISSFSFD